MTNLPASEVVTRARKCIGYKTYYRLHPPEHEQPSGMHPDAQWPWNKAIEADCSGFSSWCVGVSRFHNKVWFDTSAIAADALSPDGMLYEQVEWDKAQPGMVVVFGDYRKADVVRQGHIGIITEVDSEGPSKVAHCSHTNWNNTGDAIQETDPGVFRLHPSIVAKCKLVEYA